MKRTCEGCTYDSKETVPRWYRHWCRLIGKKIDYASCAAVKRTSCQRRK